MLKIFYSGCYKTKRVWNWVQAKQDVKKAKSFTRSCNSGGGAALLRTSMWVFWTAGRLNAGKEQTEMKGCDPLPYHHHISLGWQWCGVQQQSLWATTAFTRRIINQPPARNHSKTPYGEDRIRREKVYLTNIGFHSINTSNVLTQIQTEHHGVVGL